MHPQSPWVPLGNNWCFLYKMCRPQGHVALQKSSMSEVLIKLDWISTLQGSRLHLPERVTSLNHSSVDWWYRKALRSILLFQTWSKEGPGKQHDLPKVISFVAELTPNLCFLISSPELFPILFGLSRLYSIFTFKATILFKLVSQKEAEAHSQSF